LYLYPKAKDKGFMTFNFIRNYRQMRKENDYGNVTYISRELITFANYYIDAFAGS